MRPFHTLSSVVIEQRQVQLQSFCYCQRQSAHLPRRLLLGRPQVTKVLDSRKASLSHNGLPCKSGRSTGGQSFAPLRSAFPGFSKILKAHANPHCRLLLPDFIRGEFAVEPLSAWGRWSFIKRCFRDHSPVVENIRGGRAR
jgi:hypothetical protein